MSNHTPPTAKMPWMTSSAPPWSTESALPPDLPSWEFPRKRRTGFMVTMLLCATACLLLATGVPLLAKLQNTYPRLAPFLYEGAIVWGALVFGLVYGLLMLGWVWRIHDDVGLLTVGKYRPKPGLAFGLLFVPLFQGWWLGWLLIRLNRHAAKATGEAERSRSGNPPPGAISAWMYLLLYSVLLIAAMILPFILIITTKGTDMKPAYIAFAVILSAQVVASLALAHALASTNALVGRYVEMVVNKELERRKPPPTAGLPVSSPPT